MDSVLLSDCRRVISYAGQIASELTLPSFWLAPAEKRRVYENTRLFFVLACGRSGTNFLARLLNRDPNATVKHEPVPEDFVFCSRYRDHPRKMRAYLEYRKRRILRLVCRCRRYGEVTPALSLCAPTLAEAFPRAQFIHLVRDGRAVVRSLMSRGAFQPHRYLLPGFNPPPSKDDPLRDEWHTLSRFQKLCWQWVRRNESIREAVDTFVTLEELLSDYTYFRTNVTDPLELHVSRETWHEATHRPTNTTKEYAIPHWSEWSAERVRQFQDICGELMDDFGYGTEPRWRRKCRETGAAVPREAGQASTDTGR